MGDEYVCPLHDIDDDDVDELFIGYPSASAVHMSVDAGIIHSVYDYVDGEATLVMAGWGRRTYYLCEDNLFLAYGSSGAWDYGHDVFEYGREYEEPIESVSVVSDYDLEAVTITHTVDGDVVEEVAESIDAYDGASFSTMLQTVLDEHPIMDGLDYSAERRERRLK